MEGGLFSGIRISAAIYSTIATCFPFLVCNISSAVNSKHWTIKIRSRRSETTCAINTHINGTHVREAMQQTSGIHMHLCTYICRCMCALFVYLWYGSKRFYTKLCQNFKVFSFTNMRACPCIHTHGCLLLFVFTCIFVCMAEWMWC